MTSLIACLGSGKGTWAHLVKLIESEEWSKVFLVTNEFGSEKFSCGKEVEFIVVDQNTYLRGLRDEIKKKLEGKIADTEVGRSLISGTGKEHMAVLGAVLQLGLGIRQVAVTPEGVKEV